MAKSFYSEKNNHLALEDRKQFSDLFQLYISQ